MKKIRTINSPFSSTTGKEEGIPIKNSETIYLGTAVRLGTGGIEAVDAAADGADYIVRGFYQPFKTGEKPIELVDSANYTGTWDPTAGAENYAASATNETVDRVYAKCEPIIPGATYRIQLDDTRGTTTGSDTIGYGISTTNGRQLDESTAADSAQQFIIVGIPTDESDVVDVKVRESYVAGTGA